MSNSVLVFPTLFKSKMGGQAARPTACLRVKTILKKSQQFYSAHN